MRAGGRGKPRRLLEMTDQSYLEIVPALITIELATPMPILRTAIAVQYLIADNRFRVRPRIGVHSIANGGRERCHGQRANVD